MTTKVAQKFTPGPYSIMYKPLPDYLTINSSKIDGLGLFATKFIEANTNLGLTHVFNPLFKDNYIRTPLGGFFNHSSHPNSKIHEHENNLFLITICDINPDEEITAAYTLYDPSV